MSKIDYRTILNKEKVTEDSVSPKWWNLSEKDIPASIEATCTFLKNAQGRRQNQLITSARLYGNMSLAGMSGISQARVATAQSAVKERITYNVCASAVDTVTSKIAKNKPKPFFLTSGGDYKIQTRAKKLGKFIDGCFYENQVHKLGVQIFRDGCVFGDGVVHVFTHDGRIKVERALVTEFYVDEVEAYYGKPRQLHRAKSVDKAVLADMFPEHKEAIMEAMTIRPDGSQNENIADQVQVIESWHLPSGPKADDGLRVMSISGLCLLKDKYDDHHYPFVFFKWKERLAGFFGQGGVEEIQNIQMEINKLLWVIQRSMHLAGSFKIWLKNGSKVSKEHLNNDLGSIITGEEAPQYLVPPIVAPEIYNHLTTLKNAAYEQFGISQLSASAKKPEGLDSGKALREFNDIESDRFMTIGQAYEQLFMDIAKLMICEGKKIYKHDKGFKVNTPGKAFLETIKWSEIDMKEDEYVMQIFPVSKLPDEPEGRLQTITEMMQAGLVTPESGRRLLDFPDLEAEESLANAEEELLHKILDTIVEDGEFTPPEPTDNLALATKLTLEYIARGRTNGLEEEKLDLLRLFLSQTKMLQVKATQQSDQDMAAQQVPQGAGQPVAPANPTAPPISDLIPNVNTAA